MILRWNRRPSQRSPLPAWRSNSWSLLKHQHRPRDLARLHRAECLVNILQFASLADHVVEIKAPLKVVIDVTRHIDAETVASHHGSLDLSLGQEHRTVEFNFMADRNHPDDRRGATRLDTLKALLSELCDTDSFEGVV